MIVIIKPIELLSHLHFLSLELIRHYDIIIMGLYHLK